MSQFYFLPTFLSRSFGNSKPERLAAWASGSLIFSQHFCLSAWAIRSMGVSQLGRLAVLFSPNIYVSEPSHLVAWAFRSFAISQIKYLIVLLSTILQFYCLADLSSRSFAFLLFYHLVNLPSHSKFAVLQLCCLADLLSRSFGDSELGRRAAWASRSFIFSQHFYLGARSSHSLGVSKPEPLAT